MSRYKVEVTKAAEKDLDDLKHLRQEAVNKLLELENNPADKTSSLSGILKGLKSYKFNLNDGAYRAILKIYEGDSVCLLILIGPRENLYKQVARKVKSLKKQGFI